MKKLIAITLFVALAISARADVPGIITYQGRVTANGTNFTGVGQFKFSLVEPGPSVTWWSQDGLPTPNTIISVPVTNGLFNIALGDTTIAGMNNAIPSSVFDNTHIRLRIWFNDGVTGFAQLAPDQRLTSVGYALRAANVADGAITSGKIAPGAITNLHIANNVITSDQIADTLNLRELTLETAGGLDRIELSGSGASGLLYMNHGSIGRFLEASGTTSGGFLRLFDQLGGTLSGQTTVELGSSSVGGYVRVLQENNSTGVQINGQNGGTAGGNILLYRESGLGVVLSGSTSSGQGSLLSMYNGLGGLTVSLDADASGRGSSMSLFNGTNATSVFLDGNSGGAGLIEVRNSAGATRAELDGQGASGGGELVLRDEDGTTTVFIEGAEGVGNGAQIALYKGAGGNPSIILDADFNGEGRITTQVLEITGGSDLSENFDIQSPHAEPGMIVSIDSAHPGELAVSDRAYDRAVAGVVSGAGGVKPGLLMGQRNSKADGKHPVALTGRVYCLVDASAGAIAPGDLITTSGTPGHGMKVTDHIRAQGAIIGKAMTGLAKGKGLVLVLVSLQ